ncbi:sensor domain-containing diguanylate cyclase [Amaricoccus tamworthensis]|uniref:sensor domain-containing diguanylate cyclase n=1 Tax=Amaricoccus tamworthensis TaxID=57002 RepID=UPI003C7B7C43
MSVKIPMGLIDALSATETRDEILDVAVRWLPELVGADRGSIAVLEDGELRICGFLGEPIFHSGMVFDPTDSRVGQVFATRTPHLVRDQRLETSDAGRKLAEAGYRSSICVPLLSGDYCFGTLNLSHSELGYFGDYEMAALCAVGRLMASQIRIHEQMRQLNELAYTDPLTGAKNRRAFMNHATDLMRKFHTEGMSLAMILFDLDRFKSINDRFGHSGGDEVLRGVVDTFNDNIREQDMLARLGGEEFAIVLNDTSIMQAEMIAERFRQLVENLQRHHDGFDIRCTTSVGVAAVRPNDLTAEQILKRADAALYFAKKNGRNRVELAA